jgi:hypothetical protein
LLEFFRKRFDGTTSTEKGELLDLAVVHRRVAYGAWRVTDLSTNEARVNGIVLLLTYPGEYGGGNFGYKDLSEASGPDECACPLRIYEQLSPLPPVPDSGIDPWANARDWRARVEGFHEARDKLVNGARVVFHDPIRFDNGAELHEARILRTRGGAIRLQASGSTGVLYRHRALEQLIAKGRAHVEA